MPVTEGEKGGRGKEVQGTTVVICVYLAYRLVHGSQSHLSCHSWRRSESLWSPPCHSKCRTFRASVQSCGAATQQRPQPHRPWLWMRECGCEGGGCSQCIAERGASVPCRGGSPAVVVVAVVGVVELGPADVGELVVGAVCVAAAGRLEAGAWPSIWPKRLPPPPSRPPSSSPKPPPIPSI